MVLSYTCLNWLWLTMLGMKITLSRAQRTNLFFFVRRRCLEFDVVGRHVWKYFDISPLWFSIIASVVKQEWNKRHKRYSFKNWNEYTHSKMWYNSHLYCVWLGINCILFPQHILNVIFKLGWHSCYDPQTTGGLLKAKMFLLRIFWPRPNPTMIQTKTYISDIHTDNKEGLFRWTTSVHCNLKFNNKWSLRK